MRTLLVLSLWIWPAMTMLRAEGKLELPAGAQVIETQPVKEGRALVLWMLKPEKFPREMPDEPYTCPEYTRGHFYGGKTRVSLIDTATDKVLNTVSIKDSEGEDSFDLPYLIKRFYYKVPKLDKNEEGKPLIMDLRDFNGDGKAYEFALYDAIACMGLPTTLLGYSEKQDKVIQYHISLKSGRKVEDLTHADYLFEKKPVSPGVWKYEINYQGRGGTLDKYNVHYDKATERFVGTLVSVPGK